MFNCVNELKVFKTDIKRRREKVLQGIATVLEPNEGLEITRRITATER